MTNDRKMDMVAMNILDSTMVSVCREMGITLMKTSYSTIFNEALDFTCAIAAPNGDMLAVAEFCPAQIGGMPLVIQSSLQEIPLEEIEKGDVIVHNDPYRGGLHTPEHSLFTPVFADGELIAFTVAIGHVAEVGGMAPGSFPAEATEIFHEGIRVPPVKIKKRGEDVAEVWKLWLANVRTPRHNYGDMRALISGVEVGAARLTDVIAKVGREKFKQTCSDLMDYSEARMRSELSQVPDGRYDFEDYMDNDGLSNVPAAINVAAFVQGDEIVVDFSASSAQMKGPINATLGVTWSATYNAILHMTDETIPKNSGCFRPIRVVAPPGTLLNVNYPAPEVGGNTETHPRIAGTVMGALAPGIPARAMAAEGGSHTNFVFGGQDQEFDEYFACYDIELSGWGGRPYADGNDATDSINGNCRVMPVEVFETRYPWFTETFSLVPDSGGAGKYRGGLATTRTISCSNPDMIISQLSDRHHYSAWGLNGGDHGGTGTTVYMAADTSEWLTMTQAFNKPSTSKWSNITVHEGDRIRIRTAGGGGFGEPAERNRAAIENDLAEGYVSPDRADKDYGYRAS
jgi:N-methylhydantoinase B/oxoprolinase/acetone carboxylase alpha subunit